MLQVAIQLAWRALAQMEVLVRLGKRLKWSRLIYLIN